MLSELSALNSKQPQNVSHFKHTTLTMQKAILIFILSLFVLGTIGAQENNQEVQEQLTNQFSLALLHGIKYNDKDTLNSIYPSLVDVKNYISANFQEGFSDEEWNDLKEERADDLALYLENIIEIREESIQHNFDWELANLKDVTFQVESEIDPSNQARTDFYSLEILISDGKNNLNIVIYDAVFLNKGIKLIEIDSWIFD